MFSFLFPFKFNTDKLADKPMIYAAGVADNPRFQIELVNDFRIEVLKNLEKLSSIDKLSSYEYKSKKNVIDSLANEFCERTDVRINPDEAKDVIDEIFEIANERIKEELELSVFKFARNKNLNKLCEGPKQKTVKVAYPAQDAGGEHKPSLPSKLVKTVVAKPNSNYLRFHHRINPDSGRSRVVTYEFKSSQPSAELDPVQNGGTLRALAANVQKR